jgi:hypothetical protein
VADGEWTLEDAAVEEFAGDKQALARLAKVTGHGLHWALAEERASATGRPWRPRPGVGWRAPLDPAARWHLVRSA